MQEKWNQFIYVLSEAKKKGVDEEAYHTQIENQLQLLGWFLYNGEICHKPNIPIGNSKYIQPDILIKKGDEDMFVIEVKRPVHSQTERERLQLESYMRQLKLEVGIYIGEHIEIFYDIPKNKNAISVLKVPLELNNKNGAKFIEKFSKENFTKESIADFCEERIKEMQRQENLNKIKESIIADAQAQIAESLSIYLLEKYSSSFSENDIKGMLATLSFTAKDKEGIVTSAQSAILPSKEDRFDNPKKKTDKETKNNHTTERGNLIKCFITRNSDAKGLFNPIDQSLVVLRGSKVNPQHLRNLEEARRKKRDQQLADFTEDVNGERIVNVDITFNSPSGAAVFCVGGSSNGWTEWKDENQQELNIYKEN
ncbi:MAG: DUF4357 domain-containing protein [Prevotella sp.]|nr:DUF4357 domain-containing protein [Prevotella sp.]